MSDMTEFVDQLKEWGRRETGEQRTAMAELRRGLQEFPRLAPYMHRYLASFTLYKEGWEKQSYYLVAALFARYHSGSREPVYSDRAWDNMGSYFAAVARLQEAGGSIERRFNALLTAHPQDLHYHLRQVVAFLQGNTEIVLPINWERMLRDILNWDDDDRRARVQEAWATEFWRHKARTAEEDNPETETVN